MGVQHRVPVRAVLAVVVLLQQRQVLPVRRCFHLLHAVGVDLEGGHFVALIGAALRAFPEALHVEPAIGPEDVLADDALGDVGVGAQPTQQLDVLGLQVVPVVSQDQLRLPDGLALGADELQKGILHDVLREQQQYLDDLLDVDAGGHRGAQRQYRQLVLVDDLRPAHGLRDDHQEVCHLRHTRVEGLEDDPATRQHPNWAPGVPRHEL
mmetsp:Transcript_117042/g.372633  ORF Transcript_117042/g.372633 Transcript_117042/m.372633 type:complete len:209 (-) Transcript_117042:675-1301(-)